MIFEAKNNIFTSKNVFRSKKKKRLTGGRKKMISKPKMKIGAKNILTKAKTKRRNR